jgi:glutathione synthase/RimK-type ligase-like ATP-grasp enzyme
MEEQKQSRQKYRLLLGIDGDDFIFQSNIDTREEALEIAEHVNLEPKAYYYVQGYIDERGKDE